MKSRASIEIDNALVQRGHFSQAQIEQLLEPVNPVRVLSTQGNSYLSQQDVKAHLIRVFGFGSFDMEVLDIELVYERGGDDGYQHTPKTGSPYQAWDACYRALVRLTVRNGSNVVVTVLEDGSTATASAQRGRGDAHDLAYKSAISLSLKRAAAALGDQFGLSLYNKGQLQALVKGTLQDARRQAQQPEEQPDLQDVDEQLVDGNGDSAVIDYDQASQEEAPAPSAKPVATKRATNGRQGTRRKAAEEAPADDAKRPGAVVPVEVPEEPRHDAPEVNEPREQLPADHGTRVADADGRHLQSGGKPIPGTEEPLPKPEAEAAPDPDAIDRDDEQAVADYNATWGKAKGSYITSNAERQRTLEREEQARLDAELAEAEEAKVREQQAVEAMERQAQEEAAAAAAAAIPEPAPSDDWAEDASPEAAPSAYSVTMAEEPENYQRRAETADDLDQLRTTWNEANAKGKLTTDLKGFIVGRRKAMEALL